MQSFAEFLEIVGACNGQEINYETFVAVQGKGSTRANEKVPLSQIHREAFMHFYGDGVFCPERSFPSLRLDSKQNIPGA